MSCRAHQRSARERRSTSVADACISHVRPLLAVTWPELVQLELAKVPAAQLGISAREALAAYKVHICSAQRLCCEPWPCNVASWHVLL